MQRLPGPHHGSGGRGGGTVGVGAGAGGVQTPYCPHVRVWSPCAESIVQLWLHDADELHTVGQVPPNACSTVPVPSGAGSSGADEQPNAANATIASAVSKWFDLDMGRRNAIERPHAS